MVQFVRFVCRGPSSEVVKTDVNSPADFTPDDLVQMKATVVPCGIRQEKANSRTLEVHA